MLDKNIWSRSMCPPPPRALIWTWRLNIDLCQNHENFERIRGKEVMNTSSGRCKVRIMTIKAGNGGHLFASVWQDSMGLGWITKELCGEHCLVSFFTRAWRELAVEHGSLCWLNIPPENVWRAGSWLKGHGIRNDNLHIYRSISWFSCAGFGPPFRNFHEPCTAVIHSLSCRVVCICGK